MTRFTLTGSLGSVLLAALFLLPANPVQADPAKAEACLSQLIPAVVSQGRRLRATDLTSAQPREAVTYRLTLYKGLNYVLIGCADGDGVDLDMRLYDEAGDLVSGDGSPDNQPFVDVSPEKTGEYALQVIVYKAEGPTDFALAVSYQD
jgi:hypothetical protein